MTNACVDAREWVGNSTLAEAWRDCERADWMIWLDARLSVQTADRISSYSKLAQLWTDRAVERYCRDCGIPAVAAWARDWLNGTDRTKSSARAAEAAARAAAEAAAAATWGAAAALEREAVNGEMANDVRAAIPCPTTEERNETH